MEIANHDALGGGLTMTTDTTQERERLADVLLDIARSYEVLNRSESHRKTAADLHAAAAALQGGGTEPVAYEVEEVGVRPFLTHDASVYMNRDRYTVRPLFAHAPARSPVGMQEFEGLVDAYGDARVEQFEHDTGGSEASAARTALLDAHAKVLAERGKLYKVGGEAAGDAVQNFRLLQVAEERAAAALAVLRRAEASSQAEILRLRDCIAQRDALLDKWEADGAALREERDEARRLHAEMSREVESLASWAFEKREALARARAAEERVAELEKALRERRVNDPRHDNCVVGIHADYRCRLCKRADALLTPTEDHDHT